MKIKLYVIYHLHYRHLITHEPCKIGISIADIPKTNGNL